MIVLYDTLGDTWKSNIGPSINPIPSAAFTTSITAPLPVTISPVIVPVTFTLTIGEK